MAHAMSNLRLQRIVNRVSIGGLIERLKQGAVVYPIEWEHAKFLAKSNIGMLNRIRRAVERVWNAAERDQLVHQRRIGRVAILFPIDVVPLRTDILNVNHVASGKLALDTKVPVIAGRVAEVCCKKHR